MGQQPAGPGWWRGEGLSFRGHIQSKVPGCLGGSVMLVKSRRVYQRRLRPQAGCQIQSFYFTPMNVVATIPVRPTY